MKKKRKTYNTEGHAHGLTFSCYHQYDYLNDPKCCAIFMEVNPVRAELVENPEDWKWSSARAREYQVGLLPDDFDIPIKIY